MKKVIVTGGAGYIGKQLVNKLLENEVEVTVIDQSPYPLLNERAGNTKDLTVVESDVNSAFEKRLVELNEYEVVFHLAGIPYVTVSVESPEIDLKANLLTTFSLLEELRRCNKPPAIIFASTAAVYGNPRRIPIEESDPTYPLSPYGVSKLAAERYIEVYCKLYKISGASLRIFNVYGPGLNKQVISDIIRKLEEDKDHLRLLGDGTQERDFIYLDDLVRAFLIIAERAPRNGEVYNVASGKGISITQIANEICTVMGLSPKIEYADKNRPSDINHSIANIDRLKKLGFENKVSIQEGIRLILEHREQSTQLRHPKLIA